jgi:hypothetical protein
MIASLYHCLPYLPTEYSNWCSVPLEADPSSTRRNKVSVCWGLRLSLSLIETEKDGVCGVWKVD